MATLSQNQNQFKQTTVVGAEDWTVNQNKVSARIDPTYVGALPLVAGQAFKLVDSASGIPLITPVADATETPWAVAIHNSLSDTFVAGQTITVALVNSVIYMQSSAAIARGAKVQVDPTGPTVATLAGGGANATLGYLVDKATAADQLVRVFINPQDKIISAY